jgi:hypothetical protein
MEKTKKMITSKAKKIKMKKMKMMISKGLRMRTENLY